jgi:hypothetical protein
MDNPTRTMSRRPDHEITIKWERNKSQVVYTLQDLEKLLEQLTLEAVQNADPIAIQIKANPDTALLISVGRAESHVAFYATSARPLIVVCRGPWDTDELIEFNQMDEPSSVKKRYCVPAKDAREAVRRYFITGARPDNIEWE